MIDLVNLATYITFAAITVVLLAAVYKTHRRAKRLANSLIQSEINSHVIKEKMEDLAIKIESFEMQKSDEFVKFLSESRDWAFQYIEDVQVAIAYLKNAMESGDDEQINNAYHNLIELLPKEEAK